MSASSMAILAQLLLDSAPCTLLDVRTRFGQLAVRSSPVRFSASIQGEQRSPAALERCDFLASQRVQPPAIRLARHRGFSRRNSWPNLRRSRAAFAALPSSRICVQLAVSRDQGHLLRFSRPRQSFESRTAPTIKTSLRTNVSPPSDSAARACTSRQMFRRIRSAWSAVGELRAYFGRQGDALRPLGPVKNGGPSRGFHSRVLLCTLSRSAFLIVYLSGLSRHYTIYSYFLLTVMCGPSFSLIFFFAASFYSPYVLFVHICAPSHRPGAASRQALALLRPGCASPAVSSSMPELAFSLAWPGVETPARRRMCWSKLAPAGLDHWLSVSLVAPAFLPRATCASSASRFPPSLRKGLGKVAGNEGPWPPPSRSRLRRRLPSPGGPPRQPQSSSSLLNRVMCLLLCSIPEPETSEPPSRTGRRKRPCPCPQQPPAVLQVGNTRAMDVSTTGRHHPRRVDRLQETPEVSKSRGNQ